MSFGDLSRSGRLQGAWEMGCGCGCGRVQVPSSKLQAPSSKLCCSHILVRPRAPAFIIRGLESRGNSSRGVWEFQGGGGGRGTMLAQPEAGTGSHRG